MIKAYNWIVTLIGCVIGLIVAMVLDVKEMLYVTYELNFLIISGTIGGIIGALLSNRFVYNRSNSIGHIGKYCTAILCTITWSFIVIGKSSRSSFDLFQVIFGGILGAISCAIIIAGIFEISKKENDGELILWPGIIIGAYGGITHSSWIRFGSLGVIIGTISGIFIEIIILMIFKPIFHRIGISIDNDFYINAIHNKQAGAIIGTIYGVIVGVIVGIFNFILIIGDGDDFFHIYSEWFHHIIEIPLFNIPLFGIFGYIISRSIDNYLSNKKFEQQHLVEEQSRKEEEWRMLPKKKLIAYPLIGAIFGGIIGIIVISILSSDLSYFPYSTNYDGAIIIAIVLELAPLLIGILIGLLLGGVMHIIFSKENPFKMLGIITPPFFTLLGWYFENEFIANISFIPFFLIIGFVIWKKIGEFEAEKMERIEKERFQREEEERKKEGEKRKREEEEKRRMKLMMQEILDKIDEETKR